MMNNIEFVSAGAGSGKTYKLTETLAQALESGAARPHAILATTFTVKAATELRERARSWLLEKGRVDLATAIGQARLLYLLSRDARLLKKIREKVAPKNRGYTQLSRYQGGSAVPSRFDDEDVAMLQAACSARAVDQEAVEESSIRRLGAQPLCVNRRPAPLM